MCRSYLKFGKNKFRYFCVPMSSFLIWSQMWAWRSLVLCVIQNQIEKLFWIPVWLLNLNLKFNLPPMFKFEFSILCSWTKQIQIIAVLRFFSCLSCLSCFSWKYIPLCFIIITIIFDIYSCVLNQAYAYELNILITIPWFIEQRCKPGQDPKIPL